MLTAPARLHPVRTAMGSRGLTKDALFSLRETGTTALFVLILVADSDY